MPQSLQQDNTTTKLGCAGIQAEHPHVVNPVLAVQLVLELEKDLVFPSDVVHRGNETTVCLFIFGCSDDGSPECEVVSSRIWDTKTVTYSYASVTVDITSSTSSDVETRVHSLE